MKENTSGISEARIDAVIRSLTSNIEQLEKRFQQLDSIISSNSNVYKSKSGSTFRASYKTLSLNYGVVKKNILSYIDDLMEVKRRYKQLSMNATDIFRG